MMSKQGRKISILLIIGVVIVFLLGGIATAEATLLPGGFPDGNLSYAIMAGPVTESVIAPLVAHVEKWDNVSGASELNMNRTSNYSSADIQIRYCIDAPPTSGDLGVTAFYNEDGQQIAAFGNWYSTLCIVYNNSSASSTNKAATLMHEVGHALSMDHPSILQTGSIMLQGLKNYTTLSQYDRLELVSKWGA